MDNNAEDCPVCLTTFDDTLRRPRTLPCGDSFCTLCLNELKDQGEVTCPTCHLVHTVPETGQFPVIYAFEALVKRLRGAALHIPPSKRVKVEAEPAALQASERCQEDTKGLSKYVQSLLQDQEAKVLAAIHTCQEIQGQLQEYQTTLVNWGEQQQHLEDRLQALVDQSKSARVLIRQEESKVAIKREKEQQVEQQLQAVLQELHAVSTRHEAYEIIDDAAHRTDEEKQRVEECGAMFPDAHTVTTITKVTEASNAALEAATGVQTAQETVGSSACVAGDSDQLAAPDSFIMDRLKALMTTSLEMRKAAPKVPPATVEDLSSLTQPVNNLLKDDLMLNVDYEEDQKTLLPDVVEVEDLSSLTQPVINLLQDDIVLNIHYEEDQRRLFPDVVEVEDLSSLTQPIINLLQDDLVLGVDYEDDQGRLPPASLEVKDLRCLTQPVRNLVQDGLVFAVHHADGQSRHGRISLKDDRLYLHYLQDQSLPSHAVTVQMDQVVPAAPPCMVFLDLAWPSSPSRRVMISLDRDTTRGQQFILLCTGERGICYTNTKLFKVLDNGRVRGVRGGDYQYNTGDGGAALLPDLDSVQCRSAWQAGSVWGWLSGPSKGAQFCIVTEVMMSRNDYTFGKVVNGLEVVVEAHRHQPITEVTVVDCGVVLWA